MSAEKELLRRYLLEPARAVEPEWFPPESASCFTPFFSPACIGPMKWRAVKAAGAALVEKNCLSDFTVHLNRKLKTVAYMNDAGQVYLSAGLLLKSSALTVLSVYCHELAHIKLSQRSDYPALKSLQREFKRHFQGHKLCELLSPIEYYAMLVSRPLLADLARQANNSRRQEKLLRLTEDLDKKIRFLEEELSKLAHKTVF